MVSLTIDGNSITVPKGTTILDAAAQLGIKIPTLCWLQKVSPTGACRVCAVEVEGVDRTMTACNTPVKDGINVITQSEKLTAIRRKIMELMLVNHPLDCPVCDAAGECDLQEATYALGAVKQEYAALLERRQIRYDWPLIESDPNRCILCEKCVKVDHEIVGCDAIAVVNKGEATIIDTIDGKPLNCEFCGNCVGACPTGTLITKPFKFRGRPWTFSVTKSICAFCAVGCQVEYHTRNNRVERVTSEDSTYNSGNLCIHGRFGYSYLDSPERLIAPLLKDGDARKAVNWNSAMSFAVEKLQAIVKYAGPQAVAGIGSPRATNEDNYLFQKLIRNVIGSSNIDSEARFGYAPALEVLKKTVGVSGATNPIDRIDTAGAVLVFGSDLNAEATGIEYRVIKAATKNDAKLVLANMRNVKLKKFSNSHLQYRPGSELYLINALAALLLEAGLEDKEFISAHLQNFDELKAALGKTSLAEAVAATGVAEADLREAAALIGRAKSVAVIFGADLLRSEQPADKVAALVNLAAVAGALGKESGGLFPIHDKANIQGLLDMGVAPTEEGRDLWQIVDGIEKGEIKALYVMGSDPLTSFPDNGRIRRALEKLELLIVQDIVATATSGLAHVVFPSAAAAEKNGSFTTPDNRVQGLAKAVTAPGDAREDWDILAEVANRMNGAGRPFSAAAVAEEIRANLPAFGGANAAVTSVKAAPVVPAACQQAPFTLLAGPIGFHNGTATTWSRNNMEVSPAGYLEISADDAAKLGLVDGGTVKVSSPAGTVSGQVKVSDRLQPGLLFAPNHFRTLNVNALLTGSANLVAVKVEKG